jgi:hypothetical protein
LLLGFGDTAASAASIVSVTNARRGMVWRPSNQCVEHRLKCFQSIDVRLDSALTPDLVRVQLLTIQLLAEFFSEFEAGRYPVSIGEPYSLTGALLRINRAREHLRDLMRQIEAFRQEQLDAINIQLDPQTTSEPFLIQTRETTIPLEWSILTGEICYNLRSALDYLIYELAILDSGKISRRTQFPIEDKRKGFAHRQKIGWLDGLNATHIAAIEILQPYSGCRWTKLLRDLSNVDKHVRLVLKQGSFALDIFPNAERLRFLDIQGTEKRARDPVSGKEMNVKLNLTVEIQFSDGPPVIETLKEIQSQVADTIEAFQPEFECPGAGRAHDSPP